MAKGFLHNLEQDARTLQTVLQDEDDIPQWVSWKIYTSADRLQAAARYMEREASLVSNPRRRKPFKAFRNSPTEASAVERNNLLANVKSRRDAIYQGFSRGEKKDYDVLVPGRKIGEILMLWNASASRQKKPLVYFSALSELRAKLSRSEDARLLSLTSTLAEKWGLLDEAFVRVKMNLANPDASTGGSGERPPAVAPGKGSEETEDPPVVDTDGDVVSVDGEPSTTWLYLAGGALVLGGGLLLLLRMRNKS
jgi:hypothetical protein